MARNKLERFEENKTFPHFFEYRYENGISDFLLKGKWNDAFFKNDKPIIIELGCGKGEYTTGLGLKYPDKNFIGLDIKGSRMWVGAKKSFEKKMKNIAFVRMYISLINAVFGENEVDEIWITFPDPHLRKSKSKKRLTSPDFINRYVQFLKPNGIIHLKTDSIELYDYTMEVISSNNYYLHCSSVDVYQNNISPASDIQTYYEQIWLSQGLTIKYISFSPNYK